MTEQITRQERLVRITTPWGKSDAAIDYGPGITFYSTPSHGGFHLSNRRLAELRLKHGQVKTAASTSHRAPLKTWMSFNTAVTPLSRGIYERAW